MKSQNLFLSLLAIGALLTSCAQENPRNAPAGTSPIPQLEAGGLEDADLELWLAESTEVGVTEAGIRFVASAVAEVSAIRLKPGVRDLRPLAQLTALTTLSLSSNQLEGLEALDELPNLRTLILQDSVPGDPSPLERFASSGLIVLHRSSFFSENEHPRAARVVWINADSACERHRVRAVTSGAVSEQTLYEARLRNHVLLVDFASTPVRHVATAPCDETEAEEDLHL